MKKLKVPVRADQTSRKKPVAILFELLIKNGCIRNPSFVFEKNNSL